jgi:hypothetical protein
MAVILLRRGRRVNGLIADQRKFSTSTRSSVSSSARV